MYSRIPCALPAMPGSTALLLDEGPVPVGSSPTPRPTARVNVAEHYWLAVLITGEAAAAWPDGTVPGVALLDRLVPHQHPPPAAAAAAAGSGAPGRGGVWPAGFWADATARGRGLVLGRSLRRPTRRP